MDRLARIGAGARRAAIILGLVVPGAPALAEAFCTDLDRMRAAPTALSGFASGDLVRAACRQVSGTGGQRELFCSWDYPYRAAAAMDGFAALTAQVQNCLGPQVEMIRDAPVNHPDFYDLRRFETGDLRLSVSIKDKVALARTYVFLRVTQAAVE